MSNLIIDEMRLDDWGHDPWGTAMSWAFAVCEVSTLEGIAVAPELDYRPSIAGPVVEGYADETVQALWLAGHIDADDMLRTGRVLARYLDWCKAAGRDY